MNLQEAKSIFKSAILNRPIKDSRLIYRKRSPHQMIELYQTKDNGYWLSLNGIMQSHSLEGRLSHIPMVGIPSACTENVGSILIIGGGDGYTAREALKYPFKRIVNVELDADLIRLTKNHPVMRRLSDDAFRDPRVELIAGDGITYLLGSRDKFDVIIDDCEFDETDQSPLSRSLYHKYEDSLVSKLTDGGVGSLMEPFEPLPDFSRKPHEKSFKLLTYSMMGGKLTKKQESEVIRSMEEVNKSCDKDLQSCVVAWKKRAPYIRVMRQNFPEIGFESFIYFSKKPITLRRALL